MIASKEAEDLIKQFEGCHLNAYKCPAGVWTIGWGTTGPGIREGLVISQHTADVMLKAHIQDIALDLTDLVGNSLRQHQFDALVAFIYNIGLGAFKKSTMLSLIKRGKMDEAALEFDKWVKAAGKTLPGLVKRRKAEKTLFIGVPVVTTVTTTTSPKKAP